MYFEPKISKSKIFLSHFWHNMKKLEKGKLEGDDADTDIIGAAPNNVLITVTLSLQYFEGWRATFWA